MDDLSGTKSLIFDAFVEMTSNLGYENVTIRDIAQQVGINPATIYYHYSTKADILESAYSYHKKHQYNNRLSVAEMKSRIAVLDGTSLVRSFMYTFECDDLQHYMRMVYITKIIYMRIFQDNIASSTFIDSNRDNADYVISIMQHGVEIGRVDPGFDLQTFADVMIGAFEVMGIRAFVNPEYIVGQLDQESRIVAMLGRLVDSALIR